MPFPFYLNLQQSDSQDPGANGDTVGLESLVLATELIVVDDSIENSFEIISDISCTRRRNQFEVVSISSDVDGMDQVTAILASRQDLTALHLVITTDDQRTNRLGTTSLFADSLDAYAGDLVGWQDSLNANPEILFHGFQPESPAHAVDFAQAFESLTGARISLLSVRPALL